MGTHMFMDVYMCLYARAHVLVETAWQSYTHGQGRRPHLDDRVHMHGLRAGPRLELLCAVGMCIDMLLRLVF